MSEATPVIAIAIEPRSKPDLEKLAPALARLAAEDPSVHIKTDQESGQTVISGQTELQLDVIVYRIQREFGVDVNVGQPEVAYRETISWRFECDHQVKRQGGAPGFARIKFLIEPSAPGSGVSFVSDVVAGALPANYIVAVERAVRSMVGFGPRIGFPIVDIRFVLTDGAYHDLDSSVAAFEFAGRDGFRFALEKAGPVIVEPIMRVVVVTSERSVGDVINDLNRRRGQVRRVAGTDPIEVEALAPMANLFGYVYSLRDLTGDDSTHTLTFSHHERVPDHLDDPDGRFPPAAAMRA